MKNRRRKKPILFYPIKNPIKNPTNFYPILSQLSQILCAQILPKISTHSSVDYHPKSLSTPPAKTGEQFSTAHRGLGLPYVLHASPILASHCCENCLPTVSLLCERTVSLLFCTVQKLPGP